MIVGHIEIVTVLTILLFAIPIGITLFKIKKIKGLTIQTVTTQLNKAFIVHFIFGLVLAIIAMSLDKIFYKQNIDGGSDLTDIWMELSYTYVVIGLFYYLPALLLLNIVNFMTKLIGKK